MPHFIKNILRLLWRRLKRVNGYINPIKKQREINLLYRVLYDLVHDLDSSIDIISTQTKQAFKYQWETYKEGQYLLSDPWFKENVDKIISEEETLISRDWFLGKDVLDAGCGNGRWSYGLAKLGANLTCVDINKSALDETKKSISDFTVEKEFYQSDIENLSNNIPQKKFDLVFSWGVIHHAKSFNKSLDQLIYHVKENGILYLYLYGDEGVSYEDEIEYFKDRLHYKTLKTKNQRYNFLLRKAFGNKKKVHNMHDIYAPLINRSLNFSYVKSYLEDNGIIDVIRTIDHNHLFIRGVKSTDSTYKKDIFLPKKKPPFWFEYH